MTRRVAAASPKTGRHVLIVWDQLLPLSRAIMARTLGSGSDPRYLPLVSNTSWARLVLYLFWASAPEAVPAISARAIAIFVNMVESPVLNGCSHLMVCALAISPLEYTHRERCAGGDGNGCRCTRAEINFLDYCACRRHQCCPFMMMNENLGTFSLLRLHQTSCCLPVKCYVGTMTVKRKP